MVGAVRVSGLRETVRAFRRLEKSLPKEIREGLRKVAEPVRAAATEKVSRFAGVGRVATRTRTGTVAVEQTARKVTGKRGDFGALQMRVGFIPALEENEPEIVAGLEDMLDRLTSTF